MNLNRNQSSSKSSQREQAQLCLEMARKHVRPLTVVTASPRMKRNMRILVHSVLADYFRRFDRKPTKVFSLDIALVDALGAKNKETGKVGMTIVTERHILVQVTDPFLAEDCHSSHSYGHTQYLNTICHELVHVAQALTEQPLTLQRATSMEAYYRSIPEKEANALAPMYVDMFAVPLFP